MEFGGWKKRACSWDGSRGISWSKHEVFMGNAHLVLRKERWAVLGQFIPKGPSEIREHADLGMVVKFLHTGKFGCSMAQDELRGNKLSVSLLSFAIFSSQMYALL